jgi:predicted transcriptional regulator
MIARLTAGKPDRAADLQSLLETLPDDQHSELARMVARYGVSTDLAALCAPGNPAASINVLSADLILRTDWPEPVWAIPGILPVGLAILAGASKLGKSWLTLQIAQAIAAGGRVFDIQVERGPVLYLALEDPPRRLKERMHTQNWPAGLDVDFITVGNFIDQIGDLRNGGGERLTNQIERRGYRMVAIDTFSRAIQGDQQDVREMTSWLTPLQEMSHSQNCVIIIVDHHKKPTGFDQDVIADILGSTAKGAMADTILGLYRERGKVGAKLTITGRDVEEKNLDLTWDMPTGCWQLEDTDHGLTPQRNDLIEVLAEIEPARVTEIAEAVGRHRGNVYKQLAELERLGRIKKVGHSWCLAKSPSTKET